MMVQLVLSAFNVRSLSPLDGRLLLNALLHLVQNAREPPHNVRLLLVLQTLDLVLDPVHVIPQLLLQISNMLHVLLLCVHLVPRPDPQLPLQIVYMASVLLFSLDVPVLASEQVVLQLVVLALDGDHLVGQLLEALVPLLD